MRGVHALNVEGRVGLGIAQRLRFGQHVGEIPSLLPHLGQNEVAGAVDDARDPLHRVAGQTLADGLDDGDAAGHGRLEGDHQALLAGLGEDFVAMLGDQGLVGGDDVLAIVQRRQHQFARRAEAADEFDDDVDGGIVDDFKGIGGEPDAFGIADAGAVQVQAGGGDDLDRASGTAGDFPGVALEHADSAAAHGPNAQQADLDGFQSMFLKGLWIPGISRSLMPRCPCASCCGCRARPGGCGVRSRSG